MALLTRGGVEDTRLEAKETKKIRGQGQKQPFWRQTLSMLRTEMLEDTDQGQNEESDLQKNGLRSKIKKIVLSSSRGQGIFKDLQTSRPRTSNCVLEDSTSAPAYAGHNQFTVCQNCMVNWLRQA